MLFRFFRFSSLHCLILSGLLSANALGSELNFTLKFDSNLPDLIFKVLTGKEAKENYFPRFNPLDWPLSLTYSENNSVKTDLFVRPYNPGMSYPIVRFSDNWNRRPWVYQCESIRLFCPRTGNLLNNPPRNLIDNTELSASECVLIDSLPVIDLQGAYAERLGSERVRILPYGREFIRPDSAEGATGMREYRIRLIGYETTGNRDHQIGINTRFHINDAGELVYAEFEHNSVRFTMRPQDPGSIAPIPLQTQPPAAEPAYVWILRPSLLFPDFNYATHGK